MWVCGSGSCRCPLLVVPIYVWGFFSVVAELCILSSCWGWVRLFLCLFWCDCSAFFLGHLRFSATCHAAGYPSGVPHLADSGWLTSSCSGGLAWGWGCLGTDVLLPHLGFYLVPARLPLPLLPLLGSAPLTGASACLSPVCLSTPGVGLEGSLLHHLVFSHVPCSSSGPAACAAFTAAGSLGVFRSPGVCHCSPGCPSLTLGWVCFWPAVSQAFVGCEGSLGCPSWFVTALGSWTRTPAVGWSGSLMLSCILPWVLPSRFQCWLLA